MIINEPCEYNSAGNCCWHGCNVDLCPSKKLDTHWLSIDADKFQHIADILAED